MSLLTFSHYLLNTPRMHISTITHFLPRNKAAIAQCTIPNFNLHTSPTDYIEQCIPVTTIQSFTWIFPGILKKKIWHEGLLAKWTDDIEFGLRGNHLEWLKSYLSDRRQTVQIGSAKSTPNYLAAGVPQGSVLGPLLAIMYLNGLSKVTSNEMLFFANDGSLHASHNVNNYDAVQKTLQQDLESIKHYGNNWIITFNASKTSQQTFTHKQAPKVPVLTFDGVTVPIRENHKHLGVVISADLRFKSHVYQILLKFNRTLSPLYPISHMLPRHILLHIYKMYVQPHLDYCDTIYDCHLTITDKARLEKAQNRSARLITATPRRTHTAGLRAELEWTPPWKQGVATIDCNFITRSYLTNLHQNSSRTSFRTPDSQIQRETFVAPNATNLLSQRPKPHHMREHSYQQR